MTSRRDVNRYFVVSFSDNDPEKAEGILYEIQILDSQGKGKHAGYIRVGEECLEIEGHVVPRAVIDAARRQSAGQGEYVDSEGNAIPAF